MLIVNGVSGASLHCINFGAATDPACGSGSLLIRAADEAPCEISIYGQEKDNSTAGLARMNLVLHNKGAGVIVGNKSTLSAPQYKEEDNPELLKTFKGS